MVGLRARAVLAAGALLALAACGQADVAGGGDPTGEPTPTASPGAVAIDWANRPTTPVVVDGYAFVACTGDGPFLCISRDGMDVGSLEMGTFDLDPPGEVTVERLREQAAEYLRVFEEDRPKGCPDGYAYRRGDIDDVTVAGGPGVRVWFEVLDGAGRVVEHSLVYMGAVRGSTRMVSINASALADPGSCLERLGSEFEPEEIGPARGALDRVAAGSVIPADGR